jgi:transcriptional regulator with XRE-family HTH domain
VRNEPYKRLRELLVSERQKAEITQADLSARLKRPQSFVSKYERGERRLDVVEFGYVARAIGFDPVRFLSSFYREIT